MNKSKKFYALLITLFITACGVETQTNSYVAPPTDTQAARTLTYATFGVTTDELNRIKTSGTGAWFNDQFAKPQTNHVDYVNQRIAEQRPATGFFRPTDSQFLESFWQQAITGDDQLRQRVTYALSQIFVVSFQNDNLEFMTTGIASYYDMLGAHAFGNFRNLLDDVTTHPMMGIYLSALRNQKAIGARVPDENYAREVMQLFTIGLKTLNIRGEDQGTATYTNVDIQGLAKVFTGWSWGGQKAGETCASITNCPRFLSSINDRSSPSVDPKRDRIPMEMYPIFHEPTAKVFLGLTIPANTPGKESLKLALDKLFNHPNVGPFIGKQLIQRLVTSNPSPEYVQRVALIFNNNGQGVRGDMKEVIKAVIADREALDPTLSSIYDVQNSGKIREPVIRLANWMRAFHISSQSGKYLVTRTDDPLRSLGQSPMRSPSVFNFYRPDYQAPNTNLTASSLVAPEMQITDELSVFGYLDFMRNAIPSVVDARNRLDIRADYSTELALVGNPDALLDHISLLLLQNKMSLNLRKFIKDSMLTTTNNNNKVYQAIFLTMASPEYITQK